MNANTSLQEFIGKFEQALDIRERKKVHQTMLGTYLQVQLSTGSPLEKEAASFLTMAALAKVQEQMRFALEYACNPTSEVHLVSGFCLDDPGL